MKPKRIVSANLGRTQHRRADEIYAEIRARFGPYKHCPYRGKKSLGRQVDNMHNLLNPNRPNPRVPIEEFNFQIRKSPVGKEYWDLQAYCITCYKNYRGGRSAEAHLHFDPMSDEEVRQWYRENVGPTMACSVCQKPKDPEEFLISRGMEKGLHNECLGCLSAKSASVREQSWLSDGDWSSWKKAVIEMRQGEMVACAGWPPIVLGGRCLIAQPGKVLHADHRVPLRSGGLNDASNFQPLCSACNESKSNKMDTRLTHTEIRQRVSPQFLSEIREGDSIEGVSRRLHAALFNHISNLEKQGQYMEAIKNKKKEVNGQWVVERAYTKGVEWLKRGGEAEIKD